MTPPTPSPTPLTQQEREAYQMFLDGKTSIGKTVWFGKLPIPITESFLRKCGNELSSLQPTTKIF